jgi:CheY-like chemotaxis protein
MLNIILAEDDLILAMTMQSILERMGHNVIDHCTTSEATIKSALEKSPDLLLMDIRLEGEIDGIDTVQDIQRLSPKRIPALYLTGNSDQFHRKRAQETDYIDILVKPVEEHILKRSLQKLEQELFQ